ncbi:MAG: D-alanine--D-alanine ligase [Candidatus Liptonbacteria bacterium]|nr:D-alanine--D-alanine ligase [Candidatus Liptonbacteria bacterium]
MRKREAKKQLAPRKKIAVLMGGPSSEHEVSVQSGLNVLKHLDYKKYDAVPILIDRKGFWLIHGPGEAPLSEPEALLTLCKRGVDTAFLALHGEYGEDGFVQHVLQNAGIFFTGSGSLQSALAMNKILAAREFDEAGLGTPDFLEIRRKDWIKKPIEVSKSIYNTFGKHIVIKPVNRGSSMGVSVLEIKNNDLAPLENAIQGAFSVSRSVLAQKAIKGREVTCGVLDIKGCAEALLPTEIIPLNKNFFDFEAKYSGKSREVTPPENMPLRLIKKIEDTAIRAHKALGLRGVSRTDMIIGSGGQIYVLEVNTIPGMTEQSLLPQASKACGISFTKLLDLMIEDATFV